jgi:predicted 3-demethylubiquinone-9 3-methyltransferase (glyoxalase superfamily)
MPPPLLADPGKSQRVIQALLRMKKFDIDTTLRRAAE